MNEFDRTFFMDGIEMDVAAIEREEREAKARGGLDEESKSDEEADGGFSDIQAARMEMERRRAQERFAGGRAASRSPRVSSPVNTSLGEIDANGNDEEDEEISPTIYNKFSEMGVGSGGGSDLMKQLWEEEQRKAQAYAKGMKDALPWDDEEDAEPRMPSGEEFEGEVDPDALIPEDGVVPKMDTNFYAGVDDFLKSGPPPTVANKSGGSKKKSDVEVARAVMGSGVGGKNAPKTSTKRILAAARMGAKSTSATAMASRRTGTGGALGVKGGPKGAASAGPSGPIDERLLGEAFQYVNEVVVRASKEDAEEAEEAAIKAREEAFRKQEMKMARRAGAAGGAAGKGKSSENQNEGPVGGKVRSGGARSAPVGRKENETNNTRASSSGSGNGSKDSSMVRKLRTQAAAYANNDRNPYSNSGVGSSTGRNSVRASGGMAGAGGPRRPGAAGATAGKKKGPSGKPVDYGGSNVFDSRAKGSFDTSTESTQGYGNAGGNYNRSSYKGNASGSGLREGAKTAMDIRALVSNFESGDGVAKLRAELEKSQMSMKRSEDFARQAMMDANYR
jgi:hypothetical protein